MHIIHINSRSEKQHFASGKIITTIIINNQHWNQIVASNSSLLHLLIHPHFAKNVFMQKLHFFGPFGGKPDTLYSNPVVPRSNFQLFSMCPFWHNSFFSDPLGGKRMPSTRIRWSRGLIFDFFECVPFDTTPFFRTLWRKIGRPLLESGGPEV